MSMGRTIATQYGKQGIRCNSINPGLIRTEGGMKNVYGPMVDIMARNTLTPRLGQGADIGAMAVFLCSDDGEFITGQSICVDRPEFLTVGPTTSSRLAICAGLIVMLS